MNKRKGVYKVLVIPFPTKDNFCPRWDRPGSEEAESNFWGALG